jgi:hypothetical protein
MIAANERSGARRARMRGSLASRAALAGLAAGLLVSAAPAAAVDQDVGSWLIVVAQGDFGGVSPRLERLKYFFDPQVRLLGDKDGFSEALIRPALGWGIFDRGAIWAGYTYVRSRPASGSDTTEHQSWQQFTWSEPSGAFTRLWRTRLEQRFRTDSDEVGVRLRQLFRTSVPIRDGSPLSVTVWDEVFFHLRDTDWGQQAGFDENRFFIGMAWRYAPKVGGIVEIGYMNRYIEKLAAPNRLEHIVSATFFFDN